MFIFAHRGASAHAPENTLLSIDIALQQQADGIELDIHQHGSEFVIIHDQWLHRTTNGTGHLSQQTLDEIKRLDAGQGQSVPTLREAMELIAGRCELNIEIKGVSDIEKLLNYTQHWSEQFGFDHQQIIYSSFNHPALAKLKSLSPDTRIGALTANIPLHYAKFASDLHAESVNADVGFLDKKFVQDAKQRGLKVFSYTVDQPADLMRLREWGVDGIFANDPLAARQILAEDPN